MKTFTNHSLGTRGIRTENGMVWLDPGKSADIDPKNIVGEVPDLCKPSDAAGDAEVGNTDLRARVAELETENADLRAKLAAFDPDGDGKPGGSKPADRPALTGKTKAELLSIAKAEKVEVKDDDTNDDIRSAIELHREANPA